MQSFLSQSLRRASFVPCKSTHSLQKFAAASSLSSASTSLKCKNSAVASTSAGKMLMSSVSSSSAALGVPAQVPQQVQQRRTAATDVSEALRKDIETKLASDRMVVFLTGTPEFPRCGFTARIVDLFRQFGVNYTSYDILESDEFCEGLKEYSDWPTYPQVYVDKELIGGYDNIKTMAMDGSLVKMLKDKNLV